MIIGLSGRAGAGKTTVANYLVSRGFVKDAYARWRGTDGPDQVFNIPSWRKGRKDASVEAAIKYARSLDWDKDEGDKS